mmetsp:Transcript_48532/g.71979  ORF Transcript_48532/g.71979 Transcript_48532/m.71979 type:complete len:263 (+) Transcript_48532:186-974(+)|eukprot:CAMPEP_0195527104 /NCGR_PEP_ID=MMETSP0794_2-20130614/28561_1 /TAXON_ID=515487 /ORGANISM="Stephanopyxis turris, Strain CCMP 815" /LENGTH=262 /DNA_ID=CAMNT_0040657935 /DNA_START=186 /DNA_END=974 /DNA_ORIENTATION=+
MSETYYDILEIKPSASLIDVKKAYRRLALKHHPDRNNGSDESTEMFKRIGEAYDVLSDENRRRDYDLSLRSGAAGRVNTFHGNGVGGGRRQQSYADPFSRFDDLFRNDPFFNEAFRDMDDVFAQRFQGRKQQQEEGVSFCGILSQKTQPKKKQSWGMWLMDKLGVNVQMTSYSSSADGTVTASSYSSNNAQNGGGYTNKKTKTFIQNNGERVTVQSMERDGNIIEDKYIENKLVERRVNGIIEQQQRVTAGSSLNEKIAGRP